MLPKDILAGETACPAARTSYLGKGMPKDAVFGRVLQFYGVRLPSLSGILKRRLSSSEAEMLGSQVDV